MLTPIDEISAAADYATEASRRANAGSDALPKRRSTRSVAAAPAIAPEEVSEHYPATDQDLLRECRILMLAMIATWRWDRDDQLPNGRQLGTEWLSQIRAALDRDGRETHG